MTGGAFRSCDELRLRVCGSGYDRTDFGARSRNGPGEESSAVVGVLSTKDSVEVLPDDVPQLCDKPKGANVCCAGNVLRRISLTRGSEAARL